MSTPSPSIKVLGYRTSANCRQDVSLGKQTCSQFFFTSIQRPHLILVTASKRQATDGPRSVVTR
jgi:hypothetical protein